MSVLEKAGIRTIQKGASVRESSFKMNSSPVAVLETAGLRASSTRMAILEKQGLGDHPLGWPC